MFRRRLSIALLTLAVASLLQGALAWWAIGVAERHVLRGRAAGDVLTGFLELSVTKQRLRTWLSQALLDAGADPAVRDTLQAEMAGSLGNLRSLANRVVVLDVEDSDAILEYQQRQDAMTVLSKNLDELRIALASAKPLPSGTNAVVAWAELTRVFNLSDGADLRTVLAESIKREQSALARERAAADRSLNLVLGLAVSATGTIALAAALLALYFSRALRRPLDELSMGAVALRKGDLAHRIPADRHDEFAQLAISVNAMAEELEQHKSREIKARQQLEELVQIRTSELQHALERLQMLEARRRQLFADISHELKTPTTAIRGEAEIALRGRDKPLSEYKRSLHRIVEAVTHLGGVIDDLLTMARGDIDALSFVKQPVNVHEPLREAIDQARVLAIASGVRLVMAPSLSQHSLMVSGDAQRLRQMMTILLDNAVRYSFPGGPVNISTSVDNVDGTLAKWELRIVDQGIGIDVEEIEHLFERNFRGVRARQHRADGSGLGLAIARSLARAHGGQIMIFANHLDSCDKEERPGTCVILSIPLAVHFEEALLL